jgi:mitochondrial cardiolipin hydrolase
MNRTLYGIVIAAVVAMTSVSAAKVAESVPIAHYQVFFSPNDKIADELIFLIEKEKRSIKAAVYCLMHREIASALIDAHERGVKVEVIVDPYSVKTKSPVKKMGAANLPVFVWDPVMPVKQGKEGKKVKQRKPLMHDKFCVLGESCVWTGSFNFTFEATRSNRENVVVLESSQVAKQYLDEFERLKKGGCVPLSEYLAPKNI